MEKLPQGTLNQLQQLQQLQQMQLQNKSQSQPQKQQFALQGDGGVMIRNVIAKGAATGLKTNIVTSTTSTPSAPVPSPFTPVPKSKNELDLNVTMYPESSNSNSITEPNDPLTGMVKDVVFAMIMNIPALRTKLQVILDNPVIIGTEISKVYAELRAKLTVQELEQLNAYASQESSRRTIVSVMQSAFTNIMADGKIDMSDAPHFMSLIHDCITLFSADATYSNSVALNSNTVITFLHFVLKCILILTLDDPEETAALVMLDLSFKLVKLTVMPLIAGKKWCACFS